jgi:2-succinyl-5-enolpyruvyl-6-hydroxy-3-cyclohexene-1-carboxylate synthase
MSMARVRKRYGVPAKRGGRICYTGKGADKPEYGTITSTHGHHLRIRLDGHKHSHIFHPTWEIRYLEAAMSMVETVARAIHGAKMPATTQIAFMSTMNGTSGQLMIGESMPTRLLASPRATVSQGMASL